MESAHERNDDSTNSNGKRPAPSPLACEEQLQPDPDPVARETKCSDPDVSSEDEELDSDDRAQADSSNDSDSESERVHSHPKFTDEDFMERYYRFGYRNESISQRKSALQKDIRRNKPNEAIDHATALMASHAHENLVNRLACIASEDVSIAGNYALAIVYDLFDLYSATRKEMVRTHGTSGWRHLRNHPTYRQCLADAVVTLCKAPKCRLTDHVLSTLCTPLERPDLGEGHDSFDAKSFAAALDEVLDRPHDIYFEQAERKCFEHLRRALCPPSDHLTGKKTLRACLNEQKEKMKAAMEVMVSKARDLIRARKYDEWDATSIERSFFYLSEFMKARMKSAAPETHVTRGVPGKVHLAHALLLFTRPKRQVGARPSTPPATHDRRGKYYVRMQSAIETLLAGEPLAPVPDYALDRHTCGGRAQNPDAVDKTIAGFFFREQQALHPKPQQEITDPYYELCLEESKKRDEQEKAASAQRREQFKRRKIGA